MKFKLLVLTVWKKANVKTVMESPEASSQLQDLKQRAANAQAKVDKLTGATKATQVRYTLFMFFLLSR